MAICRGAPMITPEEAAQVLAEWQAACRADDVPGLPPRSESIDLVAELRSAASRTEGRRIRF